MNENDEEQCDMPEDFDPKEYEDYLTKLGKEQMKFLDKEEQGHIDCMRRNIRNLEKAGVTFDDERKLGYITHYAMMESNKLLTEFALSGLKIAGSKMTTVLSVLNKCLIEKMDAEDAVLGPGQDETK
jgi:hypothetical protein